MRKIFVFLLVFFFFSALYAQEAILSGTIEYLNVNLLDYTNHDFRESVYSVSDDLSRGDVKETISTLNAAGYSLVHNYPMILFPDDQRPSEYLSVFAYLWRNTYDYSSFMTLCQYIISIERKEIGIQGRESKYCNEIFNLWFENNGISETFLDILMSDWRKFSQVSDTKRLEEVRNVIYWVSELGGKTFEELKRAQYVDAEVAHIVSEIGREKQRKLEEQEREDEASKQEMLDLYGEVYKYFEAIINDDLDQVRELKSEGFPIALKSKNGGSTPIHWAAAFCRSDIISFLIDSGADVNDMDESGGTPLKWLLSRPENSDSETAFRTLLASGADLAMVKADDGSAWFYLAAYNNHSKILNTYASRIPDINRLNSNGWTCLQLAAYYGQTEAIISLLHNGADPSILSENGYSSFELVCQNGEKEAIEALYMNSSSFDSRYANLICKNGKNLFEMFPINDAMIQKLISNGGNAQLANDALSVMVRYGKVETVKMLVDHGAQLSSVPFIDFAYSQEEDLLNLAIQKGIGRGDTEVISESLAKYGVYSNNSNIVLNLLKYGADPNALEKDGNRILSTALNNAISTGNYLSVKHLIDFGADVNKSYWIHLRFSSHEIFPIYNAVTKSYATSYGGKGTLDYTTDPNIEIVRLLLESGADFRKDSVIRGASEESPLEVVKLLIAYGADFHRQFEDGGTTLITSIKNDNYTVAKYLANLGINVNAVIRDTSVWGEMSAVLIGEDSLYSTALDFLPHDIEYFTVSDEEKELYRLLRSKGAKYYDEL